MNGSATPHMMGMKRSAVEKTGGKRMKKAILATKVGMTQIFNADGVLVPVTVLEAGPCSVTQVKTVENDGYEAVQVAFVDKKEKVVNKDANGKKTVARRHGVNKAEMGHFAKAGVSGKRFVREFKFENASEYNLGDVIKADIFAEGDKIDATAISKGKGFQGAIKRLGQHRGPMAHGSKFHRHQGSNGACSSPSRVFKGKGMPGHMGSVKVTTQNLEIVRVDAENNLLLVKGAVPGAKKCLVTIKETVKAGK
jgi:large subunit ribosomal protein L3